MHHSTYTLCDNCWCITDHLSNYDICNHGIVHHPIKRAQLEVSKSLIYVVTTIPLFVPFVSETPKNNVQGTMFKGQCMVRALAVSTYFVNFIETELLHAD